jgi:hypothetical protein
MLSAIKGLVNYINMQKRLKSIVMRTEGKKMHQQQQQQHSLLSQASWGRLEMKPKRDEKQGDT